MLSPVARAVDSTGSVNNADHVLCRPQAVNANLRHFAVATALLTGETNEAVGFLHESLLFLVNDPSSGVNFLEACAILMADEGIALQQQFEAYAFDSKGYGGRFVPVVAICAWHKFVVNLVKHCAAARAAQPQRFCGMVLWIHKLRKETLKHRFDYFLACMADSVTRHWTDEQGRKPFLAFLGHARTQVAKWSSAYMDRLGCLAMSTTGGSEGDNSVAKRSGNLTKATTVKRLVQRVQQIDDQRFQEEELRHEDVLQRVSCFVRAVSSEDATTKQIHRQFSGDLALIVQAEYDRAAGVAVTYVGGDVFEVRRPSQDTDDPCRVKSSDAADEFVERVLQQAGVPDSEEATDAAATTVDTPSGGGGVDGDHDVGGDQRRRRTGPSSAPTSAYRAASAGVRGRDASAPHLDGSHVCACVHWQASLAEEVAEVKLKMLAPIQTPRRVTHLCSRRCLPRVCTPVAARGVCGAASRLLWTLPRLMRLFVSALTMAAGLLCKCQVHAIPGRRCIPDMPTLRGWQSITVCTLAMPVSS